MAMWRKDVRALKFLSYFFSSEAWPNHIWCNFSEHLCDYGVHIDGFMAHFTMGTGGHYITMLPADWSISTSHDHLPSSCHRKKMLWNPSIPNPQFTCVYVGELLCQRCQNWCIGGGKVPLMLLGSRLHVCMLVNCAAEGVGHWCSTFHM